MASYGVHRGAISRPPLDAEALLEKREVVLARQVRALGRRRLLAGPERGLHVAQQANSLVHRERSQQSAASGAGWRARRTRGEGLLGRAGVEPAARTGAATLGGGAQQGIEEEAWSCDEGVKNR